MSIDLLRAGLSGALLAGTVFLATGGRADLESLAKAAAVQAGAVVVSDNVHSLTKMPVSPLSDAGLTGALFAAAQYALGDRDNVYRNFAAAGGAQLAATWSSDYVRSQDPIAN